MKLVLINAEKLHWKIGSAWRVLTEKTFNLSKSSRSKKISRAQHFGVSNTLPAAIPRQVCHTHNGGVGAGH